MRFRVTLINPLGVKIKKKAFYKVHQSSVSRHGGTKVCLRRNKSIFKTKLNFSYGIVQKLPAVVHQISLARRYKTVIGLILYSNGAMSCTPLFSGAQLGSTLCVWPHPRATKLNNINKLCVGTTLPIAYLPITSCFFNVLVNAHRNTWFCKSGGTFLCLIRINIDRGFCIVKLPTSKLHVIHETAYVMLGRNSNAMISSMRHGKAGININRGFRPTVRGVAKNPVDHPHGGRTKSNSPEKTPWGRVAKFNK